MERASLSLALLVFQLSRDRLQHGVRILVGKGNNGGDGLGLARHLLARGVMVEVFHSLPDPPPGSVGDAEVNRWLLGRRRTGSGEPGLVHPLDPIRLAALPPYRGLWVDALLGTGFVGRLRPDLLEVILALNGRQERVLAVDVPSGLDATSGAPCPVAVRAAHTGTLGASKTGFETPGAAHWTGTVHVLEIGWPERVLALLPGS